MAKVKKKKQTASERKVDRAAFWRRRPWPVVLLSVDCAATAGASILLPEEHYGECPLVGGPHLWKLRELETSTRDLEATIQEAVKLAREREMQLVMALEQWGSGGRLGINQWLGMGAAMGAWTRALLMAAREGAEDVLTVSRSIIKVPQTRWRSWMIEESGTRGPDGFKPFDSEGWKKAATRTLVQLYPGVYLPGDNAAEAALLGVYASRSDELGALLPDRYLRQHGFESPR